MIGEFRKSANWDFTSAGDRPKLEHVDARAIQPDEKGDATMTETRRTLTAHTPHGTFTRSTAHAYTHVVVTAYLLSSGDIKKDASWSRSAAGAEKLGRDFVRLRPTRGLVLGVFPVEAI